MKIGFLHNFEVCNSEGKGLFADIFAVQDLDEQGRTTTTLYAFEVDGDNPAPGDFEDYEQEAWLEKIEMLSLDEDEDDDGEFIGSRDQIWEALTDCLRGMYGPCRVPSVFYLVNDESRMSERGALVAAFFKAVMFKALGNARRF